MVSGSADVLSRTMTSHSRFTGQTSQKNELACEIVRTQIFERMLDHREFTEINDSKMIIGMLAHILRVLETRPPAQVDTPAGAAISYQNCRVYSGCVRVLLHAILHPMKSS